MMIHSKHNVHNTEDEKVFGIIIYKQDGNEIPQDVVFIPLYNIDFKTFIRTGKVDQLLKSSLGINNNIVPVIYFQGLRWRNKSLISDLKKSNIGSAILSEMEPYYFGKFVKIILSLGTITFDQTRKPLLKQEQSNTAEVELEYDNKAYRFLITNDISSLGFPVLFTPYIT